MSLKEAEFTSHQTNRREMISNPPELGAESRALPSRPWSPCIAAFQLSFLGCDNGVVGWCGKPSHALFTPMGQTHESARTQTAHLKSTVGGCALFLLHWRLNLLSTPNLTSTEACRRVWDLVCLLRSHGAPSGLFSL